LPKGGLFGHLVAGNHVHFDHCIHALIQIAEKMTIWRKYIIQLENNLDPNDTREQHILEFIGTLYDNFEDINSNSTI